jgi:hypothetical protein
VKAFVIKIQKSGVWWAFDEAVFPVYASYAIRHFTEFVELQFAAILRKYGLFYIYWLQYLPNGFSGITCNALYCILSN